MDPRVYAIREFVEKFIFGGRGEGKGKSSREV